MQVSSLNNEVTVEKSKAKTYCFVGSKNGLLLYRRPFSVSFCRLSVNQRKIVATSFSNVATRRNPLEGLRNGVEGCTGIILYDL